MVVKPGEQKSIAGIITERGTFTFRLLCLIYWIYNTLLFLLEIMIRVLLFFFFGPILGSSNPKLGLLSCLNLKYSLM